MDEKLQEAINTLVVDKTLSLQAIQIVNDLKAKYESNLTRLQVVEKQLEDAKKFNTIHAEENAELKRRLNGIEAREKTVEEREKKMSRLEIEKECADKMVGHTLNMFNTVFANASLKTSVMRQVAIPVEGHPGNPQYGMSPTGGMVVKDNVTETTDRQVG